MMKLNQKIENKQFFQLFPSSITDFELWTQSEGEAMDAIYFSNRSGEKPCSPLVETWAGTIGQIAMMVYSKYRKNWTQAHRYLVEDYELYDDVSFEDRTIDSTDNQKPNHWKTVSTGLAADNHSETNTSIYGFNSNSPVPSDKTESSASSKMETEQSGNFQTDHRMTEHFERHASSLAKTPADMLASDNRFWTSWNYFDLIFTDTDKELTCPYYY